MLAAVYKSYDTDMRLVTPPPYFVFHIWVLLCTRQVTGHVAESSEAKCNLSLENSNF